jgi:hypothetical protein
MSGLLAVLIPIIIILAVALLILWVVRQFFAEFYEPARIIVGAVALIALLTKLLPLLR